MIWLVYALMASITWGLNYALDEKVFKSHISPLTLLAGQAWVSALVFSILCYVSNFKTDFAVLTKNKTTLYIVIASFLTAMVGNYFIAISIQAKSATLAAFVEESYPLFTLLFTFLLFKQNDLSIPVVIGGSLILAGIAVISFAK